AGEALRLDGDRPAACGLLPLARAVVDEAGFGCLAVRLATWVHSLGSYLPKDRDGAAVAVAAIAAVVAGHERPLQSAAAPTRRSSRVILAGLANAAAGAPLRAGPA